MLRRSLTVLAGFALAVSIVGTAAAQCSPAQFSTFFIRNNNAEGGTITPPWDSDMSIVENAAGDGFAAVTPRAGQKVGYGTHAFDGKRINLFNTANFTKISGKAGIVPYLNMWVTDGTNYAIISSENDYRLSNFQTRQEWKVFEYSGPAGFDWLFDSGTGGRDGAQYLTRNGVRVTLADFSSSILLADPGLPYPSYVGTGAPRGGFGFNVIFGDTQANYVGDYHIADLSITHDGGVYCASDVPEPGSLVLLGVVLAGAAGIGLRKRAKR